MLKKIIQSSISFLVVYGLAVSSAATPVLAQQKQTIADYTESGLHKYHIPGASLIVTKDGKEIVNESWGETSRGDKVTSKTPFQIGSLSKSFTALAVLQLEQRDVIKLDEPIKTYLPDFRYSDSLGVDITVRHLLDHKSGISAADGLEITDRDYSKESGIQEAVESLSGVALQTKPGDVYSYTSANYLLLGRIIEVTTHKAYATYMHEAVFKPLSMDQTTATADEATRSGLQPGNHSLLGVPVKGSGFYDNAGAPYGYITSTTYDLTKFLTFINKGDENVLKNSQLQKLKELPTDQSSYKLGWHYAKNGSYFYHGGATPEFRAEMFYYPDRNLSGVILTNKYNSLEDQQISSIMAGVRSIANGRKAEVLPAQSYAERWGIVALGSVMVVSAAIHTYRIYTRQIRIRRWKYGAGTILVVASIAISVSAPSIFGAPWHSLLLFAPDVAYGLLILCGLLFINGILFFIHKKSDS